MHVDLSENDKNKLRELKKKEGVTQATIVRKSIRNYYREVIAGDVPIPEKSRLRINEFPQGTKAIQITFVK